MLFDPIKTGTFLCVCVTLCILGLVFVDRSVVFVHHGHHTCERLCVGQDLTGVGLCCCFSVPFAACICVAPVHGTDFVHNTANVLWGCGQVQ